MARKRRGGLRARAPPKTMERALVERAKAVIDDFSPILPECTSSCKKSTFLKTERSLAKVQKFSGNTQKLEKLASHGDMIARGYATLLMIAESGKVPYTAATQTPFGEAIYAVRGKVDAKTLVAVQNYDDKRLLLLAYMPYAIKKGLHFYATKEHLYCTGKNPAPPDEYVKEALERLPYHLKKDGKSLMCRHLTASSSVPYLTVRWISAGVEVSVCENCVSQDVNMFARLTESMGSKNPVGDFDIEPVVALESVSDPANCPKFEKKGLKKIIELYVHGKLSDRALMERAMKAGNYEKNGRYLVIGRKCYGEDEKAFIQAVNPRKEHLPVVENFVKKRTGPIILESASVNKLLAYSWEGWGMEALHGYMKDESLARSVWEKGKETIDNPISAIDGAISHMEAEIKLARLPSYEELPVTASFCDSVARSYHVGGKKEALHTIKELETHDEHIKAIAYAFLSAMSMGKSNEWRYTKTERELGKALSARAKKMLTSEGNDYHSALTELLMYAGVDEKVVKK